MSFDVSHLVLRKEPVNPGDYIYFEELEEECNVSPQHYSSYLQEIDSVAFNETIVIVSSEKDMELLSNSPLFDKDRCLKIFVAAHPEAVEDEITAFLTERSLLHKEQLMLSFDCNGIRYFEIGLSTPCQVMGYYHDTIAYASHGLWEAYNTHFKKHSLWGQKEDVQYAYECILQSGLDHEIAARFKADFLDNFVFGQSLMSFSI